MISEGAAEIIPDLLIFYPFPSHKYATVAHKPKPFIANVTRPKQNHTCILTGILATRFNLTASEGSAAGPWVPETLNYAPQLHELSRSQNHSTKRLFQMSARKDTDDLRARIARRCPRTFLYADECW
jgi:hypothetical protein